MIAIGSDHGGFALKEAVIKHLQERGIEYRDFGCYDEKSVDYPKYARAVAECVAAGEAEKGIVARRQQRHASRENIMMQMSLRWAAA